MYHNQGTTYSWAVGRLFVTWLALASLVSCSARTPGTKFLLQTSLELLSTAASAKAIEELGKGMQKQWDEELAPGESLYAVKFSFQRATWSDFWSRPDIFLIVEREGGKRLVIPEVEHDWNYSDKLISFRCPTLAPGEKCALRVYDDDGTADRVFKSLLQTELSIRANAQLGRKLSPQLISAVNGELTVNGKIRLLQPQDVVAVVLDAPEAIAAAEFQVPTATGPWTMEGTFRHKEVDFGKVSLTQGSSTPQSKTSSPLRDSRSAGVGLRCTVFPSGSWVMPPADECYWPGLLRKQRKLKHNHNVRVMRTRRWRLPP
jgi:hypothetical protein